MGKVISLASHRDKRIEGDAVCQCCLGMWRASVLVRCLSHPLECPYCNEMAGCFVETVPDKVWECGTCGGVVFLLGENAPVCVGCGSYVDNYLQ